MMKIKANLPQGDVVVLGLTFANLDKLRTDGLTGAIKINGAELGIPVDIWITAAPDEKVMLDAFADGIREGTKARIDKRFVS